MNRPTLFALIVLNGLLVFVLAGEWFAEGETVNAPQGETKTLEAQDEALPSLDLETKSEDEYSDLVERPLFIKGRKPVEEPHEDTAPTQSVKTTQAFVWDLTGIFTSPKGVTVFFSRLNGKVEKDNYRKLKLGDDIDGWKLSEISLDKVTLTQAGETKMLPLRKAKPKTAPVAPAAVETNAAPANQGNRQQIRTGAPQLAMPAQTAPPTPVVETVRPVEPPADESEAAAQ